MTETATAPAQAASNDAFASMFSGPNGSAPEAPASPAAPESAPYQASEPAQVEAAKPFEPQLPDAQQPAQADAQPQNRMVPLSELHRERERRQAAEDASRTALAQLTEQLARQNQFQEQQVAIQRQQEEARQRALRAQQAQEAAQQIPDPELNPAEYARYVAATAQYNQLNMTANVSERFARMQYGNEAVDKATQWALSRGTAQQYLRTSDPYSSLVADYNAEQVRATYGTDPQSVERAVMAKFGIDYDALQKQRQHPPAAGQSVSSPAPAAQRPSVPPSLASVGQGGNPEPAVLDPMAHFNAIMGPHGSRPRG